MQSEHLNSLQLLTFTSGLLPFDIAEKSFTLADRNGDGLLNEYETQQASKIGNELTRNRLQEVITEADKSADGLIELNRAKMLAQRLGSLSVQNDSMATADRNDLKSNDIERVLNTNSNRRSLDSIFGHFDEESDGSWNRDEIEKFLHVMCIDKKQWLRALKDAHFDNNTLCELTIDDLQRILQEYDPERQFFT
ncbi:unnamed protein product [Anisakis simplex]|uniref:EF-hand domain-containing protein n=1 Tax=Anisakis simplex TaxID=6269 RepID=A0A0M3K680_ANISI|nr:unnamed protein product [Anisakis simplex]